MQGARGGAQVFVARAARPGGVSILAGDADQQDYRPCPYVGPAQEAVINAACPGGIFCKLELCSISAT
eukprot:8647155-Lingulodinium_polyedra.AAC.1